MKHYRVTLWGRGADSHMCRVTDEQFAYWKDIRARVYNSESEEDDPEAYEIWEAFWQNPEECELISEEAKFGVENYHDIGDILLQVWGVFQEQGNVTVEEVDSDQYSAKAINTVLESNLDTIFDEDPFGQVIWGEYADVAHMNMEGNIMHVLMREKGLFFEAVFSTETEFDPEKLHFKVEEIDGEHVVSGVFYEDKQIYNQGGETSEKSSDIYFIKDGKSV